MEKKNKMARVYGYLVCLVTVVTLIFTVAGIVNALLDLQDPMHSGFTPQGSPSLASFNNYKMDIMKAPEKTSATFTPDDATLREMYNAAKEEKILKVRHDAFQSITVNAVLIVICSILFAVHWIWMRRLDKSETLAGMTD